jgi:hypothetical protein
MERYYILQMKDKIKHFVEHGMDIFSMESGGVTGKVKCAMVIN